jgi:hypothetical protein
MGSSLIVLNYVDMGVLKNEFCMRTRQRIQISWEGQEGRTKIQKRKEKELILSKGLQRDVVYLG